MNKIKKNSRKESIDLTADIEYLPRALPKSVIEKMAKNKETSERLKRTKKKKRITG